MLHDFKLLQQTYSKSKNHTFPQQSCTPTTTNPTKIKVTNRTQDYPVNITPVPSSVINTADPQFPTPKLPAGKKELTLPQHLPVLRNWTLFNNRHPGILCTYTCPSPTARPWHYYCTDGAAAAAAGRDFGTSLCALHLAAARRRRDSVFHACVFGRLRGRAFSGIASELRMRYMLCVGGIGFVCGARARVFSVIGRECRCGGFCKIGGAYLLMNFK